MGIWPLLLIALAISRPVEAAVLTGAQRRFLRAHAGRLDSAKQLKRAIVTDVSSSAEEVATMLEANELIRCRFPTAGKKARAKDMADEMSVLVGAEVAQILGHTALLYRPSPKKTITFPTIGQVEDVADPM